MNFTFSENFTDIRIAKENIQKYIENTRKTYKKIFDFTGSYSMNLEI